MTVGLNLDVFASAGVCASGKEREGGEGEGPSLKLNKLGGTERGEEKESNFEMDLQHGKMKADLNRCKGT